MTDAKRDLLIRVMHYLAEELAGEDAEGTTSFTSALVNVIDTAAEDHKSGRRSPLLDGLQRDREVAILDYLLDHRGV
jgi:hypothetical protein